jgi:hypothetical protein
VLVIKTHDIDTILIIGGGRPAGSRALLGDLGQRAILIERTTSRRAANYENYAALCGSIGRGSNGELIAAPKNPTIDIRPVRRSSNVRAAGDFHVDRRGATVR